MNIRTIETVSSRTALALFTSLALSVDRCTWACNIYTHRTYYVVILFSAKKEKNEKRKNRIVERGYDEMVCRTHERIHTFICVRTFILPIDIHSFVHRTYITCFRFTYSWKFVKRIFRRTPTPFRCCFLHSLCVHNSCNKLFIIIVVIGLSKERVIHINMFSQTIILS